MNISADCFTQEVVVHTDAATGVMYTVDPSTGSRAPFIAASSAVVAAGELGSPGAASDDAKREVAGKADETASADNGADSSNA